MVGFDTSFHAVDIRLIESRIIPFVAGFGADHDLDDLVARAVEQRKVRFRAKAWALGAYAAAGHDSGFDAQLYVWGRPYFITADAAADVAEAVVRYANCAPETVDALAAEQLRALDPRLAAHTQPDADGSLPDDHGLTTLLSWKIRLLRDAMVALRTGRGEVTHPSGDTQDAGEVLANNLQFAVVEFAAALLPGWMDRGPCWPTLLAGEAGLGRPPGFTDNEPLLGLLGAQMPEFPWPIRDTIEENYEVGGFVPAMDVAAARQWLTDHAAHLTAEADDGNRLTTTLRKCDEALALAQRIGGGFAEATEIYSGFEGELN